MGCGKDGRGWWREGWGKGGRVGTAGLYLEILKFACFVEKRRPECIWTQVYVLLISQDQTQMYSSRGELFHLTACFKYGHPL